MHERCAKGSCSANKHVGVYWFCVGCCAEAEVNQIRPAPTTYIERVPASLLQGTRKSQTGWRMAQSCANPSLRPNSLINRERTGNFFDFNMDRTGIATKRPSGVWGFLANSLLNGTGNYFWVTGNYFCGSGNLQGRSGKWSKSPHTRRVGRLELGLAETVGDQAGWGDSLALEVTRQQHWLAAPTVAGYTRSHR
jgi:hypothetical protein